MREVRCYVSPEGISCLEGWLSELQRPKKALAKLAIRVGFLQAIAQIQPNTYYKIMDNRDGGHCEGLLEFRLEVENRAFRPLCVVDNSKRTVTVMLVMSKKGKKFSPSNACHTAWKLRDELEQGIGSTRSFLEENQLLLESLQR